VEPPSTPETSAAGTLFVLDSHGMIFQMYHGIGPMSAPDGRPTNAVFGVTRAIIDLYDRGAEYLIAAFDRAEPTFRVDLSAAYKAHRPPPPPDLLVQEPMIAAVFEAMRIPVLSVAGFEADDIMATLAVAGVSRGLKVNLCTSDKDCRQLLNDQVSIVNLRKGARLDAEGLLVDWGIRPDQVVDFQALVGDSVDNVPGVPGCGPKTAAKWLQQYDTLDNLVAHADEVGGPKLRDALKAAIASGALELCRKLVRLDQQVPLTFDWDGWKRRDWNGQRLLELFTEFGFRGFANKVRSTLTASGAKKNATMLGAMATAPKPAESTAVAGKAPKIPKPGLPTLFDMIDETAPASDTDGDTDFAFGALAEPASGWQAEYLIVDTAEKFAEFAVELGKQSEFSFNLETTDPAPRKAKIVGYAFCWTAGTAYYLPVRGPAGATLLEADATLAALQPIFENPAVAKRSRNVKYELAVLRAAGVTLAGIVGDSMIADYLLHAGERSHALDELSRRYLGHEVIAAKELLGVGKKLLTMDQVPVESVAKYACEDADISLRILERHEPELIEAGLRTLYDDLEIPLLDVLAEMEYHGVRLDVPFLAKLSKEMEAQLAGTEAEIHALAGRAFNIASPKQLRTILYDDMKLPVRKKTGTTGDASTDQESLERLAALGHALPAKIIEHRQVAKLKSTYVDALPALIDPGTGRLHTSFNQTVAATGRLSSSDPNLQNIPMRTDQGRQIRQAFLPAEGMTLLTADYSQIELRLLAHFCGDEALKAAFAEDRDVHADVAAQVFNVGLEAVTSTQRRVAKMVNFGVIYGISAVGLSTRLGIPRKDAELFIDTYFAKYPKVLQYQDDLLAQARTDGFVATILGRKRRFDPSGIRTRSSYRNRMQAEREAINMEIQGSAADLMKLAMLAVHRRLRAEALRANLLLSVHDELVLEVDPLQLHAVAVMIRHEMSSAMSLSVPLRVDVSHGPNWLDTEEAL